MDRTNDPSPPSSPSSSHNQDPPPLPADADVSSHLQTIYQIQNILRRQLLQSRGVNNINAGNSGNAGNNIMNNDHLSISIEDDQGNAGDNGNNNVPQESNVVTEEITTGAGFDLQLLTKWVEQAFPFIFLLALVWIYEHRSGILVFLWMTLVFLHSNQAVKKQVALREKRSVLVLAGVAIELTMHICLVYFYFRSEELWRYLISLPPRRTLNIWLTFWVIIMNDFMVRFTTMIVKCVVIIAVGHIPPHKRNAQLYSVIESASNTYRTMLPVSIWFKYMFNPNDVFANLITLMYLLMKFNTMYEKAVQFFATLRAYISREIQYGKYATSEQLLEAGDTCSICHEKMNSPIVLRCNHIFCEDCVSAWFEREKTCPLCRATVLTAGTRTHSDGTTSLLVQLF